MIHEKNSRVSLCVQELFHPRRSLRTLATSLASRKATVFRVPVYVHSHIGVMLDWVSEPSISCVDNVEGGGADELDGEDDVVNQGTTIGT